MRKPLGDGRRHPLFSAVERLTAEQALGLVGSLDQILVVRIFDEAGDIGAVAREAVLPGIAVNHGRRGMRMKAGTGRAMAAALLLGLLGHAAGAAAQGGVAEFYKGKTITLFVGSEPG